MINYTFSAENLETAILTMLLSESALCKSPCVSEEAKAWYEERFGHSMSTGFETNRMAVSRSLDSIMLGTHAERRCYQEAVRRITDRKSRKEFRKLWKDSRKNECAVREYSHRLAEAVRCA